jgi:hypothetical protein
MRSEGRRGKGPDPQEVEAAARAQLGEIGRALEAVRFRLLGVEATLPAGALELIDLIEEEEMDTRTEIRSVIQHVLDAMVEPAVRSLRAVAAPPKKG